MDKDKDHVQYRQEMAKFVPAPALMQPNRNSCKEVVSQNVPIPHGGTITCRIFEPNIQGPLNTLFFLSGTAFIANAPDIEDAICKHLCVAFGCRVITPYLRLAPENNYPHPYNDAVAAINYYLQQKEITLNKIALGGYSSGGLLALLICLKAIKLNHKISFNQLILFAPPVDLRAIRQLDNVPPEEEIKLEFFKQFVENFLPNYIPPECPDVSPASNSPDILKQLPPCFFAIGGKDGIYQSIHRFITQLVDLGVKVEALIVPSWCHTFPWKETSYMQTLAPLVSEQFKTGKINNLDETGLLPIISLDPQLNTNPLDTRLYSETTVVQQKIAGTLQGQQNHEAEFAKDQDEAIQMIENTRISPSPHSIFRPSQQRKLIYIPWQRNNLFIASIEPTSNQTYLEKIHASFQCNSHAITTPLKHNRETKKCVITGLGGIGKTQLALEASYLYADEYDLIWWINAQTSEAILQSHIYLLAEFNIELTNPEPKKILTELNKYLAQHFTRCLFVYDNVETLSNLDNLIPFGIDTLITSRYQEWQQKITLNTFQEEESVQYLLQATSCEATPLTLHTACLIAQALGNLPLALAQAAAYINREHTSLEQYLDDFQSQQSQLLQARLCGDTPYQSVVSSTWNITITKIKELNSRSKVDSILSKCALLAPHNIPIQLFVGITEAHKIIELLSAYSICEIHRTKHNDRVFSMHPLVQTVIAEQYETKRNMIIYDLINTIVKTYPYQKISSTEYHFCKLLIPHLECLLNHLSETKGKSTILSIRNIFISSPMSDLSTIMTIANRDYLSAIDQLLILLSKAYYIAGNSKKQADILEKLLKIRQKLYNTNDPSIAEVLDFLGIVYGRLGDYQKRKNIQEQALLQLIESHGETSTHEIIINAKVNLAISYGKIGDHGGKVRLLEEALKQQIDRFSNNDADTLRYQEILANTYGQLGDNNKRLNSLLEILPQKQDFYSDVQDLAKFYNSLGKAYGKTGDHKKEKEYLELASTMQTQAFGANHPNTAKTLHNLANNYGKLGNQEKRAELLQQIANIYPVDHPREAKRLADLGDALGKIGKYTEGEKHLLQATEIQKHRFGPDHPKLIRIFMALAKLYNAQGSFYQEQLALEEALKIIQKQPANSQTSKLQEKIARRLTAAEYLITQLFANETFERASDNIDDSQMDLDTPTLK